MRHNKKFNHLGRKAAHRHAMLSNMACSLIMHKRISTTLAKAKALRMYVEPLLTHAKEDTTANRRLVFAKLKQKTVVTELFQNVAEKIANRPGGYTRILRTGFRLGDAAEMAIIELVDYNENMLKAPKAAAKASAEDLFKNTGVFTTDYAATKSALEAAGWTVTEGVAVEEAMAEYVALVGAEVEEALADLNK